MDVSAHDLRMALWFFEYALGQSDDIATRIRQYTNEYLDNITPPFTRALFTYVKEGKYTFCTPGHMAGTAYQKSPVGCRRIYRPHLWGRAELYGDEWHLDVE